MQIGFKKIIYVKYVQYRVILFPIIDNAFL